MRIPPVEGTKFDPKFPDGKKPLPTSRRRSRRSASRLVPRLAALAPATALTPVCGVPTCAVAAAVPDKVPALAAADTSPAKPATATATRRPNCRETRRKPAGQLTRRPPAKPRRRLLRNRVRKPGQLVVQVIAVRDPTAAKQAYDRVKALKFPAYTEKIDVSNGVVVRVRAGPYDTGRAAEAARQSSHRRVSRPRSSRCSSGTPGTPTPMTGFDIAVIVVVLLSALLGLWRGVIREVFALAAMDRRDRLHVPVRQSGGADVADVAAFRRNRVAALIAGYALVFVGVFLLLSVIGFAFSKLVKAIGVVLC